MKFAFIIFELVSKKYAIDFNKFSLILKPNEYMDGNLSNVLENAQFKFNRDQIKIIKLNNGKTTKKITDDTRLLVGVFENNLYGIYVDHVHEITNVDESNIRILNDKTASLPKTFINSDGEDIEIIQLERFIAKSRI